MTESEIRQVIRQELAQQSSLPVGAIFAFPSAKIPKDFLPCEGQELSRVQYPELFALIGITFGGNAKKFNLPDLQGQFIRGLDTDGNVDCDSENRRELGSVQEDCFQGHSHISIGKSTSTEYSGSHQHDVYKEEHGGGMGTIFYSINHDGYANTENCKCGKVQIPSAGSHMHTFTPKVEIGSPQNSTYGCARFSSETRPTNMALIFCIKVK